MIFLAGLVIGMVAGPIILIWRDGIWTTMSQVDEGGDWNDQSQASGQVMREPKQ